MPYQDSIPADSARTWQLPDEPPIGTVVETTGVGPYRRTDSWRWTAEPGTRHPDANEVINWGELLYQWGPVTEVPPSPALAHAQRLARVAAHLTDCPTLAPATPEYGCLRLAHDATALDLVDWAKSIGADSVRFQFPNHDSDSVQATGLVGGVDETVEMHVRGLRSWLDQGPDAYDPAEPLPLAVLTEFHATGGADL